MCVSLTFDIERYEVLTKFVKSYKVQGYSVYVFSILFDQLPLIEASVLTACDLVTEMFYSRTGNAVGRIIECNFAGGYF